MCKKIAIVANVPSSIRIFRKELILDLVNSGAIVHCFAYGYTEEDKSLIRAWGAIPEDSLLNTRGMNPISDLWASYLLYKKLKQIRPDVVLACFVKPVIFSAFSAKFSKVPRIVGMIEGLGNAFTEYKHGYSMKAKIIKRIQVLLYKMSLPLLDRLVLLNIDDKKDLVDKYHILVKQVDILGGIGVDLDVFHYSAPPSKDKGDVVFLFVGRLVAAKGIFEFIEAAKLVKRKYPNVIFRVVGGFDEENPFSIGKEALKEYVAQGVIEYKGHVADMVSEFQNSHVFVLPSFYREGVPRSTQEAMAVGRPVITTDSPGCRETVIKDKNGFLVERWNVKDLAEKMEYFIEHPFEIELMGKMSRKIAEERFNVRLINAKLLRIMKCV